MRSFLFLEKHFMGLRSSKIESAEEKIQTPFGEILSAFRL